MHRDDGDVVRRGRTPPRAPRRRALPCRSRLRRSRSPRACATSAIRRHRGRRVREHQAHAGEVHVLRRLRGHRGLLREREAEPERAAAARLALDAHLAAHQLDEAARIASPRPVPPKRRVMDGRLARTARTVRALLRRHADAGVRHAEQHGDVAVILAHALDRERHAAALGELDRVAAQVEQHLLAGSPGRPAGRDGTSASTRDSNCSDFSDASGASSCDLVHRAAEVRSRSRRSPCGRRRGASSPVVSLTSVSSDWPDCCSSSTMLRCSSDSGPCTEHARHAEHAGERRALPCDIVARNSLFWRLRAGVVAFAHEHVVLGAGAREPLAHRLELSVGGRRLLARRRAAASASTLRWRRSGGGSLSAGPSCGAAPSVSASGGRRNAGAAPSPSAFARSHGGASASPYGRLRARRRRNSARVGRMDEARALVITLEPSLRSMESWRSLNGPPRSSFAKWRNAVALVRRNECANTAEPTRSLGGSRRAARTQRRPTKRRRSRSRTPGPGGPRALHGPMAGQMGVVAPVRGGIRGRS